jgi:ppGpp synthetase/RelA/SpoT-type nucleotidyltranferase
MPLPISKGELNRLGDRLIAHDAIADADLDALAMVLAAYQDVLEEVKAQLQGLGFSPGWRVKTTSTLIDKLKRIHKMQLSRIQDLAGARIIVADLDAQDEACDIISEAFERLGCAVRQIDRRRTPTFGYRALHLVITVDAVPVEIQIRTELQDAWAQMVERLADSWGRGIRYGEPPEHPERKVRTGGFRSTRSRTVGTLMQLSGHVEAVEGFRQRVASSERRLSAMMAVTENYRSAPAEWREQKIPASVLPDAAELLAHAAAVQDREPLAREDVEALVAQPENMTLGQLLLLLEPEIADRQREILDLARDLQKQQDDLRYILRLVAGAAADQGV